MPEPLTSITRDPEVMGGKPCLRGLRVTVGRTVLGVIRFSGKDNYAAGRAAACRSKAAGLIWPMVELTGPGKFGPLSA